MLEIGKLVLSTAGRDKGVMLLVIRVVDENYVLVADGEVRRLANPKKKKVKHLAETELKLDKIAEKILNGKQVFDAEIKNAIHAVVGEE